MADKEKRLHKILVKKGWKGQLKSVDTLEEAHLIILENEQSITKTKHMRKDAYKMLLQEGYTFPEDKVHYLVSTNPRDAWNTENRFMTSHGRYANISTTTISTTTYLGTGRWLLFFPSSRPIPISTTTYLGTGRWFLFFLDPPFFFSSRSRFVHTYLFLQRGSHHFAVLYLDILD